MKSRLIVGMFLLVGVFGAGTLATEGYGVAPARQWALVNFVSPVQANGVFLMGPHMILHDDSLMARGEPCTHIYRFDPTSGPKEEVVAFHCLPEKREVCATTTLTIVSDLNRDVPRLAGYQFAGDAELHGVPAK